jgi:hypothetical protein
VLPIAVHTDRTAVSTGVIVYGGVFEYRIGRGLDQNGTSAIISRVVDDHIVFQQRTATAANCDRTVITGVIAQNIPPDGRAAASDINPPGTGI